MPLSLVLLKKQDKCSCAYVSNLKVTSVRFSYRLIFAKIMP